MIKQFFKYTSCVLILISIACNQPASKNSENVSTASIANPMKGKNISVQTFLNDVSKDNVSGYGYNIYVNSALTVRQPNIPAVSGNKGFASEEEAKRTGEFVANKVRNNIMPPSVSVAELDSLKISY